MNFTLKLHIGSFTNMIKKSLAKRGTYTLEKHRLWYDRALSVTFVFSVLF